MESVAVISEDHKVLPIVATIHLIEVLFFKELLQTILEHILLITNEDNALDELYAILNALFRKAYFSENKTY